MLTTAESAGGAEVRNNRVKGAFYYAYMIYVCTDAVVTGNTCEKCYHGFYCVGTAMFKANTIRESEGAFVVTSMNGDCASMSAPHTAAIAVATTKA